MSDEIKSELEEGLAHYGIPGMKWGRRRAVGADGRVKDGPSQDYITSRKNRARDNRALSTPELQALNNRLQAERTNKDLTSAGALRKIRVGTAAVGTVLAIATTAKTVIDIANGPVGDLIKKKILKQG